MVSSKVLILDFLPELHLTEIHQDSNLLSLYGFAEPAKGIA